MLRIVMVSALLLTGCIDGSCRGVAPPAQAASAPDSNGNAPSPTVGCEPSGSWASGTPGATGIVNLPIAHPAPPSKFSPFDTASPSN